MLQFAAVLPAAAVSPVRYSFACCCCFTSNSDNNIFVHMLLLPAIKKSMLQCIMHPISFNYSSIWCWLASRSPYCHGFLYLIITNVISNEQRIKFVCFLFSSIPAMIILMYRLPFFLSKILHRWFVPSNVFLLDSDSDNFSSGIVNESDSIEFNFASILQLGCRCVLERL